MKHTAIRLNAGNDRNGNPRRVFIVFNTENSWIVEAIDEGYDGDKELLEKYPDLKGHFPPSFYTTVTEYKLLLKNYSK
jgi:hypothetical protein